jgi:hypothetical protein
MTNSCALTMPEAHNRYGEDETKHQRLFYFEKVKLRVGNRHCMTTTFVDGGWHVAWLCAVPVIPGCLAGLSST